MRRANADIYAEEEKKVLIGMVGKLYITSNSDVEKLQAVGDLVAEGLDAKIATDATSRNALTKLQAAVTKAMGDGTNTGSRKSMAPTVIAEDEVVESVEDEEEPEQEQEAADDEVTVTSLAERDEADDSVVNDLLDSDEEL
jgi:condensin complex subunit 3